MTLSPCIFIFPQQQRKTNKAARFHSRPLGKCSKLPILNLNFCSLSCVLPLSPGLRTGEHSLMNLLVATPLSEENVFSQNILSCLQDTIFKVQIPLHLEPEAIPMPLNTPLSYPNQVRACSIYKGPRRRVLGTSLE